MSQSIRDIAPVVALSRCASLSAPVEVAIDPGHRTGCGCTLAAAVGHDTGLVAIDLGHRTGCGLSSPTPQREPSFGIAIDPGHRTGCGHTTLAKNVEFAVAIDPGHHTVVAKSVSSEAPIWSNVAIDPGHRTGCDSSTVTGAMPALTSKANE